MLLSYVNIKFYTFMFYSLLSCFSLKLSNLIRHMSHAYTYFQLFQSSEWVINTYIAYTLILTSFMWEICAVSSKHCQFKLLLYRRCFKANRLSHRKIALSLNTSINYNLNIGSQCRLPDFVGFCYLGNSRNKHDSNSEINFDCYRLKINTTFN